MTDTQRQAAEAATRAFYAVLADPGSAPVESVLDDSWHQVPEGEHTTPGVPGYRELQAYLPTLFSDLRIDVDDVLVDGDRVAVRTTTRGRHTGAPALGVPATGRAIELRASDIHEIRDGRIITTWHLEDWAGLLQQLTSTSKSEDR